MCFKPLLYLLVGSSLLMSLILMPHEAISQGNGAIRLAHEGKSSLSFSSGVLEIFIDGMWGSVCRWGDKTTFGKVESDVACYQLGWNGAIDLLFTFNLIGTSQPIISDVQCPSSLLSTLPQCPFKTSTIDSRCDNESSVVLVCNTSSLWRNAYTGMIRLKGGEYVTDGRIEIYCNGEWGTVCDNGFNKNAADTVCRELGYTRALSYLDNAIPGGTDEPVWLVDVMCSTTENCLTYCQGCPSVRNEECFHTDDATLTCTYNTSDDAVSSEVFECKGDGSSLSSWVIVLIVIAAVGGLSLIFGIAVCVAIAIKCKKEGYYCFGAEEDNIDEDEFAIPDHEMDPAEQ